MDCQYAKRRYRSYIEMACNKLTNKIENCETNFFGYWEPSNILIDKAVIPVQIPGIHIDKNLQFREHIDYVTKKISAQFIEFVRYTRENLR